MHNQGGIGGSSSMGQDAHLAHHDHTFGNEQWGDMSPYIHTTMPEYGGGFGYMPPITHGLPSESLGRMPPPATPPQQPLPQQQSQAPPPPHHPQLPMLMVPSHPTWPSLLTNPNSYNTSPPVAIPPASTPVQPLKNTRPVAPPIASQPRKTLTDDDRRRMCQYHIDNPSMKQTEIGSLFGVERSTVSKVLSRKDKWLNPEDRSNSPIKKAKGKIPDIDKTLANWLRNEVHKGRHVSDAEIQEQARIYARPFREAETKINNPSWLEKFKQKHGMGGRLIRRASETNIPSAAASSKLSTASPIMANSQPSSAISSASPVHQPSASPFSGGRGGGEEERDRVSCGGMMMDFSEAPATATGATYKHPSTNQSTTSLGSVFTSEAGSSFSENTMSPTGTGQFTFSPDPNVGGFLSAEHHSQARQFPAGGPNFQRPRSQTFPTLDLEYMNQATGHQSDDPMTPKFAQGHSGVSSTAPSSALDSPAHEYAAAPPFGIDNTIASPHHRLHHSSSASSLQGRQQQGAGCNTPVIGSAVVSSVASSPVSPTQEDARRAADTLLSFIANSGPNGLVDQDDYNAVIRLTEKLRLHQQAQQAAAAARGQQGMGLGTMGGIGMGIGIGIGMGGLDRIPEGDAEMGNTGQHMEGQEGIKTEGMAV